MMERKEGEKMGKRGGERKVINFSLLLPIMAPREAEDVAASGAGTE